MKTYLITMLVLFAVQALSSVLFLCANKYPRIMEKGPRSDVLGFVGSIALAVWVAILICNLK